MNSVNSKISNIAPKVLKQFSIQGHEYISIEFVPGISLGDWIAQENPLYSCLYSDTDSVSEYFRRAHKILDGIWQDLSRLHELGIAFGDLSVGNIVIDEFDTPRLIDFEACTAKEDTNLGLRTLDFCLLHQKQNMHAVKRDIFAYHSIAVALVLRLTSLAEISDQVFPAITNELKQAGHSTPKWWIEACKYIDQIFHEYSSYRTNSFICPSLDNVSLRAEVRNLIANAAISSFSPDDEHLFPTSSTSRNGAALSNAFGCTGLLKTIRLQKQEIDKEIISHYSKAVERAYQKRLLPIGYDFGFGGIMETCFSLELNDQGSQILEIILCEWTSVGDPGLATGLTGLALVLLRQGRVDIAEEVIGKALRIAENHVWEKNGLSYGRSGVIAGACQFDYLLKSSDELHKIVLKLIADEMLQTVPHPKGCSLSLRGELNGARLLPYLCDGTAGLLLGLMLAHESDHIDYRLSSENLISLAADLGTPFMLEGSLMDGAAGLAVVLEIARSKFPRLIDRIPEPNLNRIKKYFLPTKSGLSVFHPKSFKFDFSYSQGSSGVLAALLWYDNISDLDLSGIRLKKRSVSFDSGFALT